MTAPMTGPVRPFEVTNRVVLAIAAPMTLAFITTPLAGIVDTAVVGQLGKAAPIGAVAVGAILFDLIFSSFNFLRAGTTGLTAQALGAEDWIEQRATLYRALIVALFAGIVIVILRQPLLDVLLFAIQPSAEVADLTTTYFLIRILLMPFGLINYALLGWFLGLGRAGLGLVLQAGIGGINIILSIVFVLYFGWGVAGAAWATVVAESTVAVVGALSAIAQLSRGWKVPAARLWNKAAWRHLIGVNRDIMIRSFLLIGAFTMFTAAGARQGDLALAANAVLLNFFAVASYFLDGFATAAEQLIGRAIGARFRPAFDRTLRLAFVWSLAVSVLQALVLLIFGDWLIALMATSSAVRDTAETYLFWAALIPLTSTFAFLLDGVYIGATWSREMRNAMIAATSSFVLVLWVAGPIIGNHGLWLALNAFLAMRGFGLAIMLPSKRNAAFS